MSIFISFDSGNRIFRWDGSTFGIKESRTLPDNAQRPVVIGQRLAYVTPETPPELVVIDTTTLEEQQRATATGAQAGAIGAGEDGLAYFFSDNADGTGEVFAYDLSDVGTIAKQATVPDGIISGDISGGFIFVGMDNRDAIVLKESDLSVQAGPTAITNLATPARIAPGTGSVFVATVTSSIDKRSILTLAQEAVKSHQFGDTGMDASEEHLYVAETTNQVSKYDLTLSLVAQATLSAEPNDLEFTSAKELAAAHGSKIEIIDPESMASLGQFTGDGGANFRWVVELVSEGPSTPQEKFNASYADASAADPKVTALIRPADVQRSIDTDVSNLAGGPNLYVVEAIFDIGELQNLNPYNPATEKPRIFFVRDDQPGLRQGKNLLLKGYTIRDADPSVPVTCTFWG